MSDDTFDRRRTRLLHLVRVVHHDITTLKNILEEKPAKSRGAFLKEHQASILEINAGRGFGVRLARMLCALDDFAVTMLSGRRGY